MVVRFIERIEGHYEEQEVPFGTVYRWCPDCILLECECGAQLTFTHSTEPCRCGADYSEVIQELARLELERREVRVPCHDECHRWVDVAVHREDDYRREWESLDLNGES
jgi:hypothetical protein